MDDTLSFHQLDDVKFLRYMAGCKAYATTAGFESVCEAMYPALYREGRKRGNLFRGFLFLPSFLSGDLNAHVHRIGSQCPLRWRRLLQLRLSEFYPRYFFSCYIRFKS